MTEEERVERFESAYNRIDRALTELLGEARRKRRHGFSARIRILANQKPRFARYADFLLEVGELRNAIVHNRSGDDHYIAVPNSQTVLELERIEQRLLAPERVIPKFQRVVMTVAPEESLAELWSRMSEHGYSRFPVYGREGFVGLLTSHGIARYCASQARSGRLELDASAVPVSELLEHDSRRERVAFVARDALIDDVDHLFSRMQRLEAVLITEHGKPHERPIGILCPSDVAALSD